MKVIVGPRASGKTTELINIAHETDQYIVVPNERRKRFTFKMAKDIGKPIRNPITIDEMVYGSFERSMYARYHEPPTVLMDDAQSVLENLLHGVRIDALTISSDYAPLVLSVGDCGGNM